MYEGNAAGDLSGKTVNNWRISSDTGCAFISLDGLSQVYEEFKESALGRLINEMINEFVKIDFTGITMQTHATLTAARGMMRMYEINHEPRLLMEVVRIFDLYKSTGMTDNYSNFNWFCRPSWTEPCGTIDSYMIAISLWKNTGSAAYLNDAHNIWYNGVLILGADAKKDEKKLLPETVSLKDFEKLWGAKYKAYDTVFMPINKDYMMDEKQARESTYRILFKALE